MSLVSLAPATAHAWMFHEHAAIGRRAVAMLQRLQPEDEERLDEAWADALHDDGEAGARLCRRFSQGPDAPLVAGMKGWCSDFPTLVAIAGDFSCSPAELWEVATRAPWLDGIVEAALNVEDAFRHARSVTSRIDVWHTNHVDNFLNDPAYLTRARHNEGHFALLRRSNRFDDYLADSLREGARPNVAALYAIYHAAALRFAAACGSPLPPRARRLLVRRALLSEAYALHFVEDAFAAGHLVGTEGDARTRAGTHDFYCEHGREARTWLPGDESYVAHGDGFLDEGADRDERRHAARAVARSLADLASVLRGGCDGATRPLCGAALVEDDDPSSCAATAVPRGAASASSDHAVREVLAMTVMPALAQDDIPRFATEMGPFFGGYAGVRFGGASSLAPPTAGVTSTSLWFGTMEIGVEGGVGLRGITSRATDGVFFGQIGFVAESAQRSGIAQGTVSVNERTGFGGRLHMPFVFLPGDLVLFAPFIVSGSGAGRWALVKAAEGGFFGYERLFLTPAGSFQFMAGREVALARLNRAVTAGSSALDEDSWALEFPAIEYGPPQLYSGNLANLGRVQLGVSVDTGRLARSVGAYLRLGLQSRFYP